MFVDKLRQNKVNFFYGLFKDDDLDYIKFHNKALDLFLFLLKQKSPKNITKAFMTNFYNSILKEYADNNQTEYSLLILLKAFIENLFKEYAFLDRDEKVAYITDILSNRSLKQCMEYIDARIIISTVHGAKGLEWDNVLLRGMKDYSFPSWNLCRNCGSYKISRNECSLNTEAVAANNAFRKEYLEELSVFYVAATRARKSFKMTTNNRRVNMQGREFSSQVSCFLKLPGIVPILE